MHLNSATQRLEARVSSSTGKAGATIAAKATTSKSKRSQRGAQGHEQETDDNGPSQKKQKANYLGTFANIDCFFLQCISDSLFHSFTLTHTSKRTNTLTVSAKKLMEHEVKQREATMKILSMTVKKQKNKKQMKRLMKSMPNKARTITKGASLGQKK
jgi:hypothetical protein